MQRFPIYTVYRTHGKHPRICTVRDHLTTYNSAGGIVRTCYVSTHPFCGQDLADTNVSETTIARGLDRSRDNVLRCLDHALLRATGRLLRPEQRECLNDPAQRERAHDMLDEMAARDGVDRVVIDAAWAMLGI